MSVLGVFSQVTCFESVFQCDILLDHRANENKVLSTTTLQHMFETMLNYEAYPKSKKT